MGIDLAVLALRTHGVLVLVQQLELLYGAVKTRGTVAVKTMQGRYGPELLQGLAPAEEMLIAADHEGGAVPLCGLGIAPSPERGGSTCRSP